jgi:ADP-dependent phosphofructokinase/glucokinase
MQRNDSILLTGMTSNSVSKVDRMKLKEKIRKEDKQHTKAKIAPTIQPVLDELDKEIQSTIMAQMDLVDATTDDFKTIALSLKLYKESCKKLKSRLSNIMRVTS